jgi:predicted glycoside hydrolase/deacetylase ChbG (UPF0249 family)
MSTAAARRGEVASSPARNLIINADGYGFTEGTTRAIEECIDFGTVRSVSVNVNFPHADRVVELVARHPEVSVGCHLNPIVGRPLLDPARVETLVDARGEFHYREFPRRFLSGRIRLDELRAELLAQVRRVRDLAGAAFSHVDFHQSMNRLPVLNGLFLEVAAASGAGRIRTHRNFFGMESHSRRRQHLLHVLGHPRRVVSQIWNARLRRMALARGFAMPDRWVGITHFGQRANTITVANYVALLRNLPTGFSEFVSHPGYVDDELRRYATYLAQREREREVLLSAEFRSALAASDVRLAGYRDIPLRRAR